MRPSGASQAAMRSRLSRLVTTTAVLICACTLSPARGAPDSAIPDFSSNNTAWNTDSTDFIALPNGPRPVSFDKAHPYVPNGIGQQPTYRIADLSNPILKPWAVE